MRKYLAVIVMAASGLGTYLGCYALTVQRFGVKNEQDPLDCRILDIDCQYRYCDPIARRFFWPAHQLDRMLFPRRWDAEQVLPN